MGGQNTLMPNYQTKSSLIETDTEKQVLAKKRSAFITEYIRSPDEHEKTNNCIARFLLENGSCIFQYNLSLLV